MKITVCVGSSCHIKGSKQVVDELQKLISENGVSDKVELAGTFCMGKCHDGVSVSIGDNYYSVTSDSVEEFFRKEVLNAL
ncbi:MAG: (2Fe-2S) ferredoxin domain-containing protein [Clostridia bacterium]